MAEIAIHSVMSSLIGIAHRGRTSVILPAEDTIGFSGTRKNPFGSQYIGRNSCIDQFQSSKCLLPKGVAPCAHNALIGNAVKVCGGHNIVVGIAVKYDRCSKSFQMGNAFAAFAPFPCLCQGRKQHSGKNSNYRYYNEKFDQGEGIFKIP